MKRKIICCRKGFCIKLVQLWIFYFLSFISTVHSLPTSAILLNANPVSVKRVLYNPYRIVGGMSHPRFQKREPREDEDYIYFQEPPFTEDDAFQFEPSDAVDDLKYSQPVIEYPYQQYDQYRDKVVFPSGMKVPSSHKNRYSSLLQIGNLKKSPTVSSYEQMRERQYAVTRGYKFLDSLSSKDSVITEATVTSDYRITDDYNDGSFLSNNFKLNEKKQSLNSFQRTRMNRNNFTESNDSHVIVPSNPVYSYYIPSPTTNIENHTPTIDAADIFKYPTKNVSDIHPNGSNKINDTDISDNSFSVHTTTLSFDESDIFLKDAPEAPLSSSISPEENYSTSHSSSTDNIFDVDHEITLTSLPPDKELNITNALPPVGSTMKNKLSSGSVAGIVIAVLVCITGLTSAVIYLIYRRYNGKCTSVVEAKFNSDNCGYLDDSLRSSVYLNNHIELPKENSEEMTSLDNDSFLNSLETMTIQNYWADNTKNTKV